MSEGLKLYLDFCVFLFGAAIGSFLNVCIYRMPRDLSVVSPPSACPHCHTQIKWYHNIPLLTYLAIGGKCRYCGVKITPRYFLVELLTALAFLTLWKCFDGWLPAIYWVFVAGLIVATFVDFEHFIIPNEITLGGIVVGFVASVLYPPLHQAENFIGSAAASFLGIVVGGGVLFGVVELGKKMFGKRKVPLEPGTKIIIADRALEVDGEKLTWDEIFFRDSDRIEFRAATLQAGGQQWTDVAVSISETVILVNGTPVEAATLEATSDLIIIPREAMGLGDVKLLAGIGAFLGWPATLFIVFTSSVLGGLIGATLVFTGKAEWQSKIPYGPYIVAGALIWLFFGPQIMHWYFAFIKG